MAYSFFLVVSAVSIQQSRSEVPPSPHHSPLSEASILRFRNVLLLYPLLPYQVTWAPGSQEFDEM